MDVPILVVNYTISSFTVVTAHVFFIRILNRNFMTACHNNFLHGLNIANLFSINFWD